MAPPTDTRRSGGRWEPLLDAALAAGCYVLAYRVRFTGATFREFLPDALATLPIVVASQMAAFAVVGVYRVGSTRAALRRLFPGALGGSLLAAALVWQIYGLVGVSRTAFGADLLLLAAVTAGWRTGRALWRQQHLGQTEPGGDLVDRAAERPTLGGTIAALVRYRELIRNLVLKELKLKYRGSVLGFVWSLLNPLVMIGVYSFAFTVILQNTMPGFVFFLMLGTLAWGFFASSATMSTGAIIDGGSLIQSVAFPRAILPIATVLFNFAQFLLTLLVFLPLMLLVYQVPLSAAMLTYPLFLAMQVLFTVGVALLLSAGTAFFRDIKHLLEVTIAVLFWLTPILYPVSQVSERLRLLILLSPLSPFIVAYHQIFYYRQFPELTLWVVGAAYSVGTFLMGAWLFLSVEDQLAEQL